MPTEQWCNHKQKLHEWGFDQQTLGMSNSMIRNSIEERENKNDGRIWQVYSARSNHLSVSQDQKEKKLAGLISLRGLSSLFKHPILEWHIFGPYGNTGCLQKGMQISNAHPDTRWYIYVYCTHRPHQQGVKPNQMTKYWTICKTCKEYCSCTTIAPP